MDNLVFQKIKDIISKNQDVVVIVGLNPTLDQMAAGLGFYLVLKQMGKNVVIACPTDPLVAHSSLVGIDKVQKNIGATDASGDLTVSFPYKEGEIEKVSYTLDNGTLNIVVKAGEKGISFHQSAVQFKRAGKMPTLLILIGVSRLSEVASLYTPQSSASTVSIINIDNKPENEKYGNIVVVDQKWSSVSEQVADFVTLLEPQIELDRDTAQNLLAGINFATNDFTSPRTSYLAFEVAGILMKKGATRGKALQISQNSQGANTVQNANQFFPPTSQFQPSLNVQQPMAQSQQVPFQQQMSKFMQPSASVAQPLQQAFPSQQSQRQPSQNINSISPVPIQQISAAQNSSTLQTQSTTVNQVQPLPEVPKQSVTPPDWLTPKVYKGSSIL